ncbi:MAG: class II fructose-bisphosphatase [Actinomycetota bacterium]|nr:class II fructose-bisphosphatase [Actinomycetota bacterium]
MSAADMDALAVHLLRGTQEAALACRPWVGRGDSDEADSAAVSAMRSAFDSLPGRGTVVIGEGEKDEAPMLFIGESVGNGDGPAFDLAVDPLENTSACARAAEGAIAVVAAAPEGDLWGSPASWYMDKIVVGRRAAGAVEIGRPVEDNLQSLSKALDKPVDELITVVLDKPRHEELVERIYAAGAKVVLIPDGDVFGALRVLLPDAQADALVGVGGAPEGVITACVARLLGGDMQASLAPQSDEEREKLAEAGEEPGAPMSLDDLVSSDACCFVATSVTAGQILRGPVRTDAGWRTQSFVATPSHRRLVVDAVHVDHDGADTSKEAPDA